MVPPSCAAWDGPVATASDPGTFMARSREPAHASAVVSDTTAVPGGQAGDVEVSDAISTRPVRRPSGCIRERWRRAANLDSRPATPPRRAAHGQGGGPRRHLQFCRHCSHGSSLSAPGSSLSSRFARGDASGWRRQMIRSGSRAEGRRLQPRTRGARGSCVSRPQSASSPSGPALSSPR